MGVKREIICPLISLGSLAVVAYGWVVIVEGGVGTAGAVTLPCGWD
jgi:hypothetical protein